MKSNYFVNNIGYLLLVGSLQGIFSGGCASSYNNYRVNGIYNPRGNSELNKINYSNLESKIEQNYIKREDRSKNSILNTEAKVKIQLVKDEYGLEQPAIIIRDNSNNILEMLYFSEINSVKGLILKDKEDKEVRKLSISYKNEVKDEIPYFTITYFELEVKDNLEGITEAISALSYQYQRRKKEVEYSLEKKGVKGKVSVLKSKKDKLEYKYLEQKVDTLSIKEQRLICLRNNIPGKEVIYLGEKNFENCSDEASTKGVDEIINNLELLERKNNPVINESVILICGNATEQPANKCPSEVRDFGNLELSFLRAYNMAETLGKTEYMKDKILRIYPMGMILDKKNVDVYLVKNNTPIAAKKIIVNKN